MTADIHGAVVIEPNTISQPADDEYHWHLAAQNGLHRHQHHDIAARPGVASRVVDKVSHASTASRVRRG